jgi:ribosomal RNA-processing protein 9
MKRKTANGSAGRKRPRGAAAAAASGKKGAPQLNWGGGGGKGKGKGGASSSAAAGYDDEAYNEEYGDSDSDGGAGGAGHENVDEVDSEDDEGARETAEDKRIRMAKEYLMQLEQTTYEEEGSGSDGHTGEGGGFEEDGEDDDNPQYGITGNRRMSEAVGKRLEREHMKTTGRYQTDIADGLRGLDITADDIVVHRGHKVSATDCC